jgi:hypothetical protein
MVPATLDFNKPGAFPTTTTKISVRFVPLSPLEFPVKNQPMKTSDKDKSDKDNNATFLQLAEHLESFALPASSQINTEFNRVPLALLPEKSLLKKSQDHFYVATRVESRSVDAPATTKILPQKKSRTFLKIRSMVCETRNFAWMRRPPNPSSSPGILPIGKHRRSTWFNLTTARGSPLFRCCRELIRIVLSWTANGLTIRNRYVTFRIRLVRKMPS